LIIVDKYQRTKPLITSENIPIVRKLIGRVRILITGRRNILNSVRHAPTMRATHAGSTETPDTIRVVAQTATESMIQCKIIRILLK
jgi:hypothetical protein